MRTTENRPRYDRKGLRYLSDLTDPEWNLVKPLIPPAKRGGRKREIVAHDVLNEILYVLSTS
jgi:transposase